MQCFILQGQVASVTNERNSMCVLCVDAFPYNVVRWVGIGHSAGDVPWSQSKKLTTNKMI